MFSLIDMKYPFGTFLISRPDEIGQITSVDDLLELTEAGNATDGIPEIEKLQQLSLILSGSNENLLSPVVSQFAGGSNLFLVARTFRDLIAAADNDRPSKMASDWADSESWNNTDVNPFDLYGMLHFLNAVCVRACSEDKELYLLLTT
jgi:hypothetical protein